MDYSFFENQNYLHLKELANELEIKEYKNKKDLISLLISFFDDYEKIDGKYKIPRQIQKKEELKEQDSDSNSNSKYKIIKQLGNAGKEGVTFLVERKKDKKEFAMKTFKKTKSKKNILHEANCQNMASKTGVCPKVIDIDLENNLSTK
jgi:hypothetical protein